MSLVLFAPHEPSPDHLRVVVAQMRKLGPPRLRAVWRRKESAWYAIEGSHRSAAAKHLGMVPILQRVRLRDEVDHDTSEIWPDRRVASILRVYDDLKWWVRHEFAT